MKTRERGKKNNTVVVTLRIAFILIVICINGIFFVAQISLLALVAIALRCLFL